MPNSSPAAQPNNIVLQDEQSTALQAVWLEAVCAQGADGVVAMDACTKMLAMLLVESGGTSVQRREAALAHARLATALAHDLLTPANKPAAAPSTRRTPPQPWLN